MKEDTLYDKIADAIMTNDEWEEFRNYRGLSEISNKIPDDFYLKMLINLIKSQPNVIKPIIYYNLCSSTEFWVKAFKTTCDELGLGWLKEYWDNLPWYKSDILDGDIENEIITRFLDRSGC